MVSSQFHYTKRNRFMPFLLAEILNFQGSTHHIGVGSFSKLKGGNFTRVLALIIAVVIAFFCTLGQSAGSWKSFGIYLGVGVLLWLWMVLVNWKKHPVEIETVEGLKKF